MVNLDGGVCVLSYEFCTTKYGWMFIKGHSSCCCWFHWDFTWTVKLVLHSGLEGSAIGAACIESLCIETGMLDFRWKLLFFFLQWDALALVIPAVSACRHSWDVWWSHTYWCGKVLLVAHHHFKGDKLLYSTSCGNFLLSRRFLCCRCCELLMTSWLAGGFCKVRLPAPLHLQEYSRS